jgi:hypothetical protein
VVVTPQHNRTRHVAFVHLGKTAGTAITCAFSRPVQQSKNGGWDARKNCPKDPEDTAIKRQVRDRHHLLPAPINDERFDSFLITLRNPVDRVVSWISLIL